MVLLPFSQETRPSQGENMSQSISVLVTRPPKVVEEEDEEEEAENKVTCFGCNSISMVEATDEHLKLKRSAAETKQVAGNAALDTLHLLWKGYERSKALFERLLNPREHLKLYIGYAKLEESGMKEKSDFRAKRKYFERARDVLRRALGNFSAPEFTAERDILWKEWNKMLSRFNELQDAHLVCAELKRRRHA